MTRYRTFLQFTCFTVVPLSIMLMCSTPGYAQRIIEEDIVFDNIDLTAPEEFSAVVITGNAPGPKVTMKNNASGNGVQTVIVGGLEGHRGKLLMEANSYLGMNSFNPPTLGVYNGGQVGRGLLGLGLSPDSHGSVQVESGARIDSYEVHTGISGTGVLDIQAGGQVHTGGRTIIGYLEDSTGVVNVVGNNSKLQADGGILVGGSGSGTINISAGGKVETATVAVGTVIGGAGLVNVSGEGSSLTLTGVQAGTIGSFADGTLNITDGGRVTASNGLWVGTGVLGQVVGSGRISVSDGGFLETAGSSQLQVGGLTPGEMAIESGGTVNSFLARIGGYGPGTGNVTVTGEGSSWNVSSLILGALEFEDYATAAASLNVSDSGTVRIDEVLEIYSTGRLTGNGGTIEGTVDNFGTIAPGNSPGELTIVGDLYHSGIIEIEIASASNYDILNVTGTIELAQGSTISLVFIDGFLAGAGDQFSFLTASNLEYTGNLEDYFDYSLAQLGNGLSWNASFNGSTLSFTAVPEPSSMALLLVISAGCAAGYQRKRKEATSAPDHKD